MFDKVLKDKNKVVNKKKKIRELARRVDNKEYDELILMKNRDRVKRCRENKKTKLANKENTAPDLTMDCSSSMSVTPVSEVDTSCVSVISPRQDYSSSSPRIDTSSTQQDDSSSTPSSSTVSMASIPSSSNILMEGFSETLRAGPILKVKLSLPSRTTRQKDAGLKRRRETLREKNSYLGELNDKVKILEETNNKLEHDNIGLIIEKMDMKKTIDTLTSENKEQYGWFKILWKNCNQDTKKEIKAAVNISKDEFPRGVLRSLRDNTGINFSNPLTLSQPNRVSGDLQHKIEEFAILNSFEVPDKKKAKTNIRFMRHFK